MKFWIPFWSCAIVIWYFFGLATAWFSVIGAAFLLLLIAIAVHFVFKSWVMKNKEQIENSFKRIGVIAHYNTDCEDSFISIRLLLNTPDQKWPAEYDEKTSAVNLDGHEMWMLIRELKKVLRFEQRMYLINKYCEPRDKTLKGFAF